MYYLPALTLILYILSSILNTFPEKINKYKLDFCLVLSRYLCVYLCVQLSISCNLLVYFRNTMVAAKETGCGREASTIRYNVT
jgi:hypothetical protein